MLEGGQPSAQPCASARDGLGRFQPAASGFDLAGPGQGALESNAHVPTCRHRGAWGLAGCLLQGYWQGGRCALPQMGPWGAVGYWQQLGRETSPLCPFPGKNLRSQLLCQVQRRRSGFRSRELGPGGGAEVGCCGC